MTECNEQNWIKFLAQRPRSSRAPTHQPGKSSSSFFTVPIRNANTRSDYYRAIEQFLAWVERAGYRHLEDIEPITVAAYIETLQRHAASATVKQHMAAICMLFSWLKENPKLSFRSLPLWCSGQHRRGARALPIFFR
jgi:hypothetical protein